MSENYSMTELVKAARLSGKLAEALRKMLAGNGNQWTVADEINGLITDAIVRLSGEADKDSFDTYETVKLIKSEMSDEETAEALTKMQTESLPKPHLTEPETFEENYRKNGGYLNRSHETPPAKVYEKLNKTTSVLRKCEKENTRLRGIVKDATNVICNSCDRNKFERFGCCDLCRWQKYRRGEVI